MGSKCSASCHKTPKPRPSNATSGPSNDEAIIHNPAQSSTIQNKEPDSVKRAISPLSLHIERSMKNSIKEKMSLKTSQLNSPGVPTERKDLDINLYRSFSAKINKEVMSPRTTVKFSIGSNPNKSKNVKYEDSSLVILSKQKKKILKFRNSMFLNRFLIEKFQLKVNFEQIPKKQGDTSLDNPQSNSALPDLAQINPVIIKEDSLVIRRQPTPPVKFYFKEPFLNELLANIYELNTAPLKKYELIYEEKVQEHKMKIYYTNYATPQKNKVNIFRTEFYVPCHPLFFLGFMNNIPEQTKIDFLLDKYYAAETHNEKTNVIYLSYKKTIITSARDFIYLKHMGEITREGETFYCDTSRSIEHPDFPPVKDVVRGDIIYSGHVVKLFKDEKGREMSFCRMYSECDFKVNVPAFISKKFSKDEMKAYTERCIVRIKELLKIK